MLKEEICCFFGHWAVTKDVRQALYQAVETAIEEGVTLFLNGGDGAFGALCAEVVAQQKKQHPQIKNCLVPTTPIIDLRQPQIAYYDEIDFTLLAKYRYKNTALYRDRHMVSNSGWAICFVQSGLGETAQILAYARYLKLHICNLA